MVLVSVGSHLRTRNHRLIERASEIWSDWIIRPSLQVEDLIQRFVTFCVYSVILLVIGNVALWTFVVTVFGLFKVLAIFVEIMT